MIVSTERCQRGHPMIGYATGCPLCKAHDRIIKLELALHQIAGHGNITGDRAREIASEALGISGTSGDVKPCPPGAYSK